MCHTLEEIAVIIETLQAMPCTEQWKTMTHIEYINDINKITVSAVQ